MAFSLVFLLGAGILVLGLIVAAVWLASRR